MMFKYMSVEINNYKQFKEKLDIALTSTADDMVRVGYLLAQARDTDILKESGYSGMGEFAKKEYGLTPDQTSRFISIAERFGDGQGRLQDQWQQFGYSKLSEMLTLPDKVAEAISPEITRDEIRELKAEAKEEEKITPIEAEIEKRETKIQDPEAENTPMIRRFFKAYFQEKPEEFLQAISSDWANKTGGDEDRKTVLDALAPSGIAILEAKIPGEGRYLLSFKGEEALPMFVGIRSNTSTELYWAEVRKGFSELVNSDEVDQEANKDNEIRRRWSELYGTDFPEKEQEEKPEKKVKIAPAQSKKPAAKEKPIKVTGKKEPLRDVPGAKGGGTVKIVEEAPKADELPFPDGEEPEITHVSPEDPLPEEAAVKEETLAAGEEPEEAPEAAGVKEEIAPAQAKKKKPKVEKNSVDISKITPVDQQIKVTGTPKDTPDAPGTRGGGTVKIEPPAAAPTACQPAKPVEAWSGNMPAVAKIGERELQRIADGLRSIADEVEDIYTRPKEELDGMRSEIEDLRGEVNLVIENARLWLNVSEEAYPGDRKEKPGEG